MRLVIVWGAASAKALLAHPDLRTDARWVCVDVRAEGLLASAGVDFVRQEEYLDEASAEGIDVETRRLAGSWFETFPAGEPLPGGVRVEGFSRREFDYALHAVLRTYRLLEGIATRHAPCRLITAVPDPSEGIRLEEGEAPMREWLDLCNARWGFDATFLPLPALPARRSAPEGPPGPLARLASRLSARRRPEVLLSGNVSLLAPVEDELSMRGVRCAWIRRTTRLRHLAHAFSSRRLLSAPARTVPARGADGIAVAPGAFRHDGVDFGPVMARRIGSYYRRIAPLRRAEYLGLVELLRRARPGVVVLDEDVTEFKAMLAEAALRAGARRLVVVHGIPGKPLGSTPLRCDRIAAWGAYDRERLLAWGVPGDRIVVTGCPKYDQISREAAEPRTPGRPRVLLAPTSIAPNAMERFAGVTSNPYERMRMVSHFLRAAREFPGVGFVLKFHGSVDDPRLMERARLSLGFDRIPANFEVVGTGDALDWVRRSSLLVSLSSSIVLEAALLRVPVAVANFSTYPDQFPFAERAALRELRSYGDVAAVAAELSEGRMNREGMLRAQEALVEEFLTSRDGRAASRVADLVQGMRREVPAEGAHS